MLPCRAMPRRAVYWVDWKIHWRKWTVFFVFYLFVVCFIAVLYFHFKFCAKCHRYRHCWRSFFSLSLSIFRFQLFLSFIHFEPSFWSLLGWVIPSLRLTYEIITHSSFNFMDLLIQHYFMYYALYLLNQKWYLQNFNSMLFVLNLACGHLYAI